MDTPRRPEGRGLGDNPGVPSALPRGIHALLSQVDPALIDRLWIFPPLRKGRREHGLVVTSGYVGEDRGEEGRRLVATLAYRAEESGKGVVFDPRIQEEGEAPADRIPRVISGVVRRTQTGPGEPIRLDVEGDLLRLSRALAEEGIAWSPPAEPSVDPESMAAS
jgi:hypothetical protein